MGNGRLSGSSRVWMCSLGAVLMLVLAGSALLGLSGSRRYAQATAQGAGSLIPTSRSFFQGPHSKPESRAILGQLPLIFEPNQGQADQPLKFLARGAGYSLFLDATSATLGMQTHASPSRRGEHFVRMKLVGANPAAATAGTGLLPGKSNYFIGNDPHKWHTEVPQFSSVQYENIYPGINLVFYGKQGHLEYDFKVAPGADPSQAELQFDGATKLELNGGDLILTGADDGGLRLQAPQIYQLDGDRRNPVAGHFVRRAANRVGFEIGPYDRSRELVIDPVLQFSTYFGGSGSETSPSVAVDTVGNIYLVGSTTSSSNFPVVGALLPPSVLPNIFVAKIAPSQPPFVSYLAFLGGSVPGGDTGVGIGVDGGGNAYIVGNTTSPNFPHAGSPYQTAPETKGAQCAAITCTSVFVSKLNSLGTSLLYSSYLSGNGNDQASGMTIDNNQDVFLTGTTTSNAEPVTDEFPATQLPPPFQTTPLAAIQFFVTEVNTKIPGKASVAYSTYFGGVDVAGGTLATGGGIAVDSTGDVYFSGTTNFFNSGTGQFSNGATDFPILNAYQPCLDTVPPTTLTTPIQCIAPTTTPYPTDAFVAKLNPNNAQTGAAQLLFSTYLGGTGTDSSSALAIDPGAGSIYLTGATNSTDFVLPTGTSAFQPCLNNPGVLTCPTPNTLNTDAYVARFTNPVASTTGTQLNVALTYFSYLGGANNDSAAAIAVDTANDAFVTGTTNSTNFPVTTGAIQSVLNGTQNAFFAHIDTNTITGQNGVGTYSTYFGGTGVDHGTSIVVDTSTLNSYFAGDTTSPQQTPPLPSFPLIDALQTTLNGPSDAFVAELVPAPSVVVAPTLATQNVSAGTQVTLSFIVTNQGPDLATGVFVNGAVSSTNVVLNSATAGSGSCSGAVSNAVVCLIPTLQAGSTSTVSLTVTPSRPGAYEATAQVVKINNTNTNVPGSASFNAAGFSMSVSPFTRTVQAGKTTQYTVQLGPQGPFGANVSLSCSGNPASSACSFTSGTVSFPGGTGSASTVLNLTTTPQPITTVKSGGWRGPLYGLWLMLPGMAVLGLSAGSKRRSRWLYLLMVSVLFSLVLLQPSCSSGAKTPPQVSGTPSGTYSMTVTATSGTLSQSQTIQVTVTP